MRRFSERNGYADVPAEMRLETMSDPLRNMLWNAIDTSVSWEKYDLISQKMWHKFYKLPLDSRPSRPVWNGASDYTPCWHEIRTRYFKANWAQVYDHVEFFLQVGPVKADFINSILADEGAAYRVIDGQICAITSAGEIAAIESAIKPREKFQATAEHFQTALSHLSNRENPDLRNVIKESITALEATAKVVARKDNVTLGDALAILEKQGRVDATLKKGFGAIYGWTNGPSGIRHAMSDSPQQIDREDAKFYLILCSAFSNYLEAVSIK
ncbi:hypothetical protein O0881_24750 [Janthinobacterium sp. SUN100]|uniref:AbiJ-NTD4 domain-containing protein n=1 Tax=Janthinobacterium sp. SUN100 TaxID=3004101 RepID=UPI0025AF2BCA|nr:hypothetical protein [Janthinobacterium sp. SUN100]MDN2705205.1 hypothetical protein [Janthinobacterium sp. SUN100]